MYDISVIINVCLNDISSQVVELSTLCSSWSNIHVTTCYTVQCLLQLARQWNCACNIPSLQLSHLARQVTGKVEQPFTTCCKSCKQLHLIAILYCKLLITSCPLIAGLLLPKMIQPAARCLIQMYVFKLNFLFYKGRWWTGQAIQGERESNCKNAQHTGNVLIRYLISVRNFISMLDEISGLKMLHVTSP
jgi:hypothetical protein